MVATPVRLLDEKRVLIVEDEYFLADDLAFAVRMAGGQVLGPYRELEPALAVTLGEGCDIAVLDVNLGRWGLVFPLAERLQWRSVPFVFATGYDSRVIPERLRNVPLWTKPFSPAYLIAGLSAMLDLTQRT